MIKIIVLILLLILLCEGPKKEVGCAMWGLVIIGAYYLFKLL